MQDIGLAPLKRQVFIPHLTCFLYDEIIEALISKRHAKTFENIDPLQVLLGVIRPLHHVRRKLEDRVALVSPTIRDAPEESNLTRQWEQTVKRHSSLLQPLLASRHHIR